MPAESIPIVATHQPCPTCGSSDARSVREDGSTFCFSCRENGTGAEVKKSTKSKVKPMIDQEYRALTSRKISEDTCRKFRYGVAQDEDGSWLQVASYGNEGQKCRSADKKFFWLGKHTTTLFGSELWKQGGERLVITEGELDALSVYEACGDLCPVVSLVDGAGSAAKGIKENFEFVTSFQKIVLSLDMDEPGRKAVEECLALLPVGKVYLTEFPFKDASDVLVNQGARQLRSLVLNAKPYRPDGIVDASSLWEDIETPPPVGLTYPWPYLTEITFGVRKKELVVLGAGTGVGKTTVFKQVLLNLMSKHGVKVGGVFLEESNRDTVLQLMSMAGQKRVHIAGDQVDPKEKRLLFDRVTSGGLLSLYDSFGATQFEVIRDRIRYMVAVEGCEYIFLDHLTALTDGCSSDSDINQRMRNIVSTLAGMTRELDFGLFAISHLRKAQGTPHEEGGRVHLDDLYGAAALKQWASFVFGIERDQQAEDYRERNRSNLRCLKDRLTGQALGEIVRLAYSPVTCVLTQAGDFEEEPSGNAGRKDF